MDPDRVSGLVENNAAWHLERAKISMLAPRHLEILVEPYGLVAEELLFLRRSQNLVYACDIPGKKCIIRISIGRHRSRSEVEAELAWVSLLADRGIRVCRPIPTQDGDLCVVKVLEGDEHIVTCFERAPGHPISREKMDCALYGELGRLIGRIHTATADLAGQGFKARRVQWCDSRLVREDFEAVADRLSPRFRRSVADLIDRLGMVAKDCENFGLIHGDVSFGNCHLDGGQLWIFDFDNCEFGYFLQDLAVVLYDSIYCQVLNRFADAGLNDRVSVRWEAFLGGYSETGLLKRISPSDLKEFFLLREAVIYVHYQRILDISSLDDSFSKGLEVMKSNVENQNHQVTFDGLGWTASAIST